VVESVLTVLVLSDSLVILNFKTSIVKFKSRSKLLIKRFDCAVAIVLRVTKIFHKLPSELV
jgi:hypothetical protein